MKKPYHIASLLGTFLLFCLILPVQAYAEETWCAVTDNNHIVSIGSINYLASTSDSKVFHVVLNDGTAITEVEYLTFSKFHVDGLADIDIDKATELRLDGDKILVSNARLGATLSIMSIDGRCILSTVVATDKHEVDISSLANGVYILNVDDKPMKFRKL